MIDLRKQTGLDLELDKKTFLFKFGEDLNKVSPDTRTLGQMKEVLFDKNIKEPKDLYYMYRGVYKQKDLDTINKNNLRFDITLIKPDRLGRELMKTAGHYHVGVYPELYDVVWGEALCLLQKPDPHDPKKLLDVILVEAKKGQKIICIPGYGHILVNASRDLLITANWVSTRFESQYAAYKAAAGAAYFIISKNGNLEFVPNSFFKELPKIKKVKPNNSLKEFGLEKDKPIYSIIREDITKLDFLNQPEKFDFSDAFVK